MKGTKRTHVIDTTQEKGKKAHDTIRQNMNGQLAHNQGLISQNRYQPTAYGFENWEYQMNQ